ncbi:MAG: hypothetical protein K4571_01110 [Deltaproteobacteria bacterium]
MKRQGPVLETLTRRLTETPVDFLDEPHIGGNGRVHVAAVVQDILSQVGEPARPDQLVPFTGTSAAQNRNRLAIVLILCWLMGDEWFRQEKISGEDVLSLLTDGMEDLAKQVASKALVDDPERREELARLALARLGYRPSGETVAQAQDRLVSLSSTERARVLQASREAEKRARAIREALKRKAAEESADKWTRE